MTRPPRLTRRPAPAPTPATAFTLVEAALSVAIVGVMLVAAMGGITAVARQRRVQAERRAAYALGGQLMAEVLSQPFQDPATTTFGPAAGQARSTFDGVDEYNGYAESPPALRDGTVLSDYAGWTRQVAVTYADPANAAAATATATTLKRVTVTVTAPGGKPYALTGLRSKYGANEYLPQVQTTLLPWMGVAVQSGTAPRAARSAARPMNVTASQH